MVSGTTSHSQAHVGPPLGPSSDGLGGGIHGEGAVGVQGGGGSG